jgi:hypothetical protein
MRRGWAEAAQIVDYEAGAVQVISTLDAYPGITMPLNGIKIY